MVLLGYKFVQSSWKYSKCSVSSKIFNWRGVLPWTPSAFWFLCLKGYKVPQLTQRDRATGWVNYGQKWKTKTWRRYFTDI